MDDKIKVNIPEEVRGLVIGRKHCNLNRIQAQTGAKIEVIDREIYVSGGQQERTRAIRQLKSIYMNRTENFERKIKVGIPEEVMGFVIGKRRHNLNRIQEETGAKIDIINGEICVSGGQQECRHAITLLKTSANRTENFERKIMVGIPEEVMGFVIGKNRHNLNRIQEETGAKIDVIKGEIYTSGGQQECRRAILQLKTSAQVGWLYNNSLMKQSNWQTYDFVDGSGRACEFQLQPLDESPRQDWYQNKEYFRIERIYEEDKTSNEEMDIDDLNNIICNILQKIQDGSNGGEVPKANFWCHFGHIYITGNVDEADVGETYSLENFQDEFNKESGWKMVFDSAFKNMKIEDLENALSESESKAIPSHIRYDLKFLTPSCSSIRVKFFVDFNGKPLNQLDFVSQFIDVKRDPSSLTSQYVFCESFILRGKISIAIPSRAMDVRILIRTVSSSRDMKEKEYEETLKNYLDKIVFTDEGQIKLPDDTEMPDNFVLQFCRKCNRRFYTHTETEEDSFTIVISEEEERNELNVEEVKNVKTDVHLYSDQCNGLLRSEDWQPEQIVSKLPTFLSALRGIQDNISNSGED